MYISIIIAMYNAEKYLRQCLDSVQACPDKNIECIMVNDGSTDDTMDIGKEYVQKDSRFYLINKENTGVSDSRNVGVGRASGEYIFFLDSDDFIKPEMWPLLCGYAKDDRYDIAAFGYESLFPSGKAQMERFLIETDISDKTEDMHRQILATPMLNTCWGKLLKRKIIMENALKFREDLKTCEDAVFMIDFIQCASGTLLCNTSVLYYRINEDGAMYRTDINQKLKDFYVLYCRRKGFIVEHSDETMRPGMLRESFSVVTDLLLRQAMGKSVRELQDEYREILLKPPIDDILTQINSVHLTPYYKKMEYFLLRHQSYFWLAFYFKMKNCFAQ
ncbi:glycosyl transferase [Clostridia bacterium]|nr:glycosyl transferase [Clostridia bacterium]